MGFSRLEYWSGLPFPSPGGLPDPGTGPRCLVSPSLGGRFFTSSTSWDTGKEWFLLLFPGATWVLLEHSSIPKFHRSSNWKWGFQGSSYDEESACIVGDLSSIPGQEDPPGEGHGNRLQYSCLENSMDRGAWCAAVHGITKSQT